jgi:deoxyribonuclease-4
MIPGIHVSTAGGIYKAPLKLQQLGFKSGQIFTANQRRWRNRELSSDSIAKFRDASEGMTIISHASYLINFASANSEVVEKSCTALVEELHRCRVLGIRFLVMHPGAHQKTGLEKGIEKISSALRELLPSVAGGPVLLLENTAGAGTTIGYKIEELAAIRDRTDVPELTGYCIDTAHAHGAGYVISSASGVSDFEKTLSSVLGQKNVRAFHMNDSKVECSSRRDRHEHFGKGMIGVEGLALLFQSSLFCGIPGIAETPGTDDERAEDIRKLTS